MREKIKKCYVCSQQGIANTTDRTMTRIKVAGVYRYVHTDECLSIAKLLVKLINQYTNKMKRTMHSALVRLIRKIK